MCLHLALQTVAPQTSPGSVDCVEVLCELYVMLYLVVNGLFESRDSAICYTLCH